jgi:hypothetical protein
MQGRGPLPTLGRTVESTSSLKNGMPRTFCTRIEKAGLSAQTDFYGHDVSHPLNPSHGFDSLDEPMSERLVLEMQGLHLIRQES